MLKYLASSSPTAAAAAAVATNLTDVRTLSTSSNMWDYFGILCLMSLQQLSGGISPKRKAELKYKLFSRQTEIQFSCFNILRFFCYLSLFCLTGSILLCLDSFAFMFVFCMCLSFHTAYVSLCCILL